MNRTTNIEMANEYDNVNKLTTDESADYCPSESNEDFCTLEDDVKKIRENYTDTMSSNIHNKSDSVDIESVKRKADEIAISLRRFQSNKSIDSCAQLDIEPTDEWKRIHKKSTYVAQKLLEDKLLYEKSKKRNEAVVDKVKLVKSIQKNTSDIAKEMKKDDNVSDELLGLKLEKERLEVSILHLQKNLLEKHETISQQTEQIRTLNEELINVNMSYQNSLENSTDNIKALKSSHADSMKKVVKNRDAIWNQLEIIRKRYMTMEEDLKLCLLDRSKLMNTNYEMKSKLDKMNLVGIDGYKCIEFEVSNDLMNELCCKINDLQTIVNEFCLEVNDSNEIPNENEFDESDTKNELIVKLNYINNTLETFLSSLSDKFGSISEIDNTMKQMERELLLSQSLNIEKNLQIHKLNDDLMTSQNQIDLSEQKIHKLNTKIKELEELLEQSEKTFQMNSHQMKYNISELELELETLKTNFVRTNEESTNKIINLQQELELSLEECVKLRRIREELLSSNDRLENDFVVLQKRDFDDDDSWKCKYNQLKDQNDSLVLDMSMLKKTIELYEQDKQENDEFETMKFTISDLKHQLETTQQSLDNLQHEKMKIENDVDQEMKLLKEKIKNLNNQLSKSENELHELSMIKTEYEELKEKYNLLERENSYMKNDTDKYNNEINCLKVTLRNQLENIRDLETRNSNISEEIIKLKIDIDILKKNEDFVNCANNQLKTELNKLLEKNLELSNKCKDYENSLLLDKSNITECLSLSKQKELEALNKLHEVEENLHSLKIKYDTVISDLKQAEERRVQIESKSEGNLSTEKLRYETLKTKYQKLQVYCKMNLNKTDNQSKNGQNIQELEMYKQNLEKTTATVISLQNELSIQKQRAAELEKEQIECKLELKQTFSDVQHANSIIKERSTLSQIGDPETVKEILKSSNNEIFNLKNQLLETDKNLEQHYKQNVIFKNIIYNLKFEGRRIIDEVVCIVDKLYILQSENEGRRIEQQELIHSMKSDLYNFQHDLQNHNYNISNQISKYKNKLATLEHKLIQTEKCLSESELLISQKDVDLNKYIFLLKEYEERFNKNVGIQMAIQTEDNFTIENPTHKINDLNKLSLGVSEVMQPKSVDYTDCCLEEANFVPKTKEEISLSEILEHLIKSFNKVHGNDDDKNILDNRICSTTELNIHNEEFLNTSFKFVDLFDAVFKYYASLPGTEVVATKLQNILSSYESGKNICQRDKLNHEKIYPLVIELVTKLECENKYLLDALKFVEDMLISQSTHNEYMKFDTVLESWRLPDHSDIIDGICEEYDIVPGKLVPGDIYNTWKENIRTLFFNFNNYKTTSDSFLHSPNEDLQLFLESLMKKMHTLIGDLYFKYRPDKNFDPNEFFEQIDDVNRDIEKAVQIINKGVNYISNSDHYNHNPNELEHIHEHKHKSHTPLIQTSLPQTELEILLAKSNKKIDHLVVEIMEIKNSREYKEVQQLHKKLDETMYQLHLKDVHGVELTQELTQLLSERDCLQLKLSDTIRQNEYLREAYISSNSFENSDNNIQNLDKKLEELRTVNNMKDPLIHEVNTKRHDVVTESNEKSDGVSSMFSVPSLFKWFSGEIDN